MPSPLTRLIALVLALSACSDPALEASPPTTPPPSPPEAGPSEAPPPPSPPATVPSDALRDPSPPTDPRAADELQPAPADTTAPLSQDPACAPAAKLLAEGDRLADDDPQAARRLYLKVVKDYPICPEVAHVYVAFGDYYFARGELANAEKFYAKAATFPDPQIIVYAAYKVAWCDLNEGEAARALEKFVKVIEIADRHNTPYFARLREAALRDSAFVYAEVGDPRKAAAFYRKVAGEAGARIALRRLAELYAERGERSLASLVCEDADPGTCQ